MTYVLARGSQKVIPETSGIYAITCRYRKKIYIGSTYNFRDRFGKHLSKLIRGNHRNKNLQLLFDRKQVLFFSVIKTCSDFAELLRHEQDILNKYANASLNVIKKVRYYQRRKPKC